MDLLVILAIVGWVVNMLYKAGQKQKTVRQASRTAPGEGEGEGRPMRPADVDLPGQATMPIHWEGTDAAGQPVPAIEARPAMQTSLGFGNGFRPSPGEVATERERLEREAPREANPVTIPGLDMTIDGDTLVKGVIFAEILTRRTPNRRTR